MEILTGIALKNYRGLNDEFNFVYPMSRFNFFLGENNSGKSTFLNFLSTYYHRMVRSSGADIGYLERNISGGQIEALVRISPDDCLSQIRRRHPSLNVSLERNLNTLINELSHDGSLWMHWKEPFKAPEGLWPPIDTTYLSNIFARQQEWQWLWSALTGNSGGALVDHWIPGTIHTIQSAVRLPIPQVKLIPAKRQLGEKGGKFDDYSGAGLIDELARLQNPDVENRADKEKFDRINQFVQTVLDDPQSEIEIPHDRNHILVHNSGRVLPLNSLGTGIHELILIAAFCTISENSIVCIEEPENHLHPKLQKSLIKYLSANTSNQYVIASHSNAFMASGGDHSVFHVAQTDNHTVVRPAVTPNDKHTICYDLGYLPSDILQANCCIWVEGPSDRLYLNHWISEKDNNLIEGLNYSIMFYGGRLLSHLSASDSDLEEFIALRRLNRRSAILIDSDKSSSHSRLNETKKRLLSEFSEAPGFCWVTKGREIENYVDPTLLEEAIASVHARSFGELIGAGQFDNPLKFRKNGRQDIGVADKIGVARFVTERAPDFGRLDLNRKVDELIRFIGAAG